MPHRLSIRPKRDFLKPCLFIAKKSEVGTGTTPSRGIKQKLDWYRKRGLFNTLIGTVKCFSFSRRGLCGAKIGIHEIFSAQRYVSATTDRLKGIHRIPQYYWTTYETHFLAFFDPCEFARSALTACYKNAEQSPYRSFESSRLIIDVGGSSSFYAQSYGVPNRSNRTSISGWIRGRGDELLSSFLTDALLQNLLGVWMHMI